MVGDDHGIKRDVLPIRPQFIKWKAICWVQHSFFKYLLNLVSLWTLGVVCHVKVDFPI